MGRNVAPSIPATTSIVNYFSAGGTSRANLTNYLPSGATAQSGAAGANELVTVLNLTGSGWVSLLAAYSNSATPAHTIRLQVIVDGTTVFDATSDTITTTINRGVVAVNAAGEGSVDTGEGSGPEIRFNASLVVKIASSQAGTNYVALRYQYHLT